MLKRCLGCAGANRISKIFLAPPSAVDAVLRGTSTLIWDVTTTTSFVPYLFRAIGGLNVHGWLSCDVCVSSCTEASTHTRVDEVLVHERR